MVLLVKYNKVQYGDTNIIKCSMCECLCKVIRIVSTANQFIAEDLMKNTTISSLIFDEIGFNSLRRKRKI